MALNKQTTTTIRDSANLFTLKPDYHTISLNNSLALHAKYGLDATAFPRRDTYDGEETSLEWRTRRYLPGKKRDDVRPQAPQSNLPWSEAVFS